jgi:hypothetical protein
MMVEGNTGAMMQDSIEQKMVMQGQMTQQEHRERQEARGDGALTGAAIVDGAIAARVIARAGPPLIRRIGTAVFGRGGLANGNRYARIGTSFHQTGRIAGKAVGYEVFRIAIGRQRPFEVFGYRFRIHWHLDLWEW